MASKCQCVALAVVPIHADVAILGHHYLSARALEARGQFVVVPVAIPYDKDVTGRTNGFRVNRRDVIPCGRQPAHEGVPAVHGLLANAAEGFQSISSNATRGKLSTKLPGVAFSTSTPSGKAAAMLLNHFRYSPE